jgi:hypothetical protein
MADAMYSVRSNPEWLKIQIRNFRLLLYVLLLPVFPIVNLWAKIINLL